jgi:hypothetical protein
LTSLGIGEAVVTVLSERGAPTPVAWTRLRSPRSLMAAIGDDAISTAAKGSPLQATYGETKDRESAYEKIQAKIAQAAADQPAEAGSKSPAAEKPGWWKRFVNSRGFQTFLKALGTELIRGMFGGGGRRRR